MFNKFLKELFDEDSVWIGWSIYWRVLVISIPVSLAVGLIAIREELAFLAGALSAFATMAILGAVMRRVALNLPGKTLSSETLYIGWATFWRYALVGLPGFLLIFGIVIALAAVVNFSWIILLALPFLVLWLSVSMGWAAIKVKHLIQDRKGSEPNV